MAENKTRETKASVTALLNAVEDPRRRAGARKIAAMMRRATGERARMWGSSLVGYGKSHYKYDSGRDRDFMTGKSCLYINKLQDVDEKVLGQVITRSVKIMRKRHKVN